MTQQDIEKFKEGTYVLVPKWDYYLKYLSLLGIVTLIFYIGFDRKDMDTRIFDSPSQKNKVLDHLLSQEAHMSLKDKEDLFVTRREYVQTLQSFKETMDRLEKKIDKLEK